MPFSNHHYRSVHTLQRKDSSAMKEGSPPDEKIQKCRKPEREEEMVWGVSGLCGSLRELDAEDKMAVTD